MKKIIVIVIASLLLLTSCAGNNITSQIAERGGLMFLDSYLSYADGTDGRICTVMKDHFGYTFILTNTSRRSDREYLYHIIENLSFD